MKITFASMAISLVITNLPAAHAESCDYSKHMKPTVYGLPSQKLSPTEYARQRAIEGFGLSSSGQIVGPGGTMPACKAGNVLSMPGSSGNCQIPYFSIGADTSLYPPGTIIEVRSMRNRIYRVGDKEIVHPGFVIVDNDGTGPMASTLKKLKGKGRFDFYMGHGVATQNFEGLGNVSCGSGYRVIPTGDKDYPDALKAIEEKSGAKIQINLPKQRRADTPADAAT